MAMSGTSAQMLGLRASTIGYVGSSTMSPPLLMPPELVTCPPDPPAPGSGSVPGPTDPEGSEQAPSGARRSVIVMRESRFEAVIVARMVSSAGATADAALQDAPLAGAGLRAARRGDATAVVPAIGRQDGHLLPDEVFHPRRPHYSVT